MKKKKEMVHVCKDDILVRWSVRFARLAALHFGHNGSQNILVGSVFT